MDIKQNLSSGQTASDIIIEQESKDEKAIIASIVSQLVIRTMAKDIEALSKEAQSSASLYTKPALKPGLAPTPQTASPLKPIVISPLPKKVIPPSDLPMFKEEIKPLTPPVPPPPKPAPPAPPHKPTLPAALPVLPKLTPKPASISGASTLKQPFHIAALAPVAAPKIAKPRLQKISLAKLGIIVGVLIVVFLGLGGWFYFGNIKPTSSPTPSATPSSTPTPSATPLILPSPPFNMEGQKIINLAAGQKLPFYELLGALSQSSASSTFTQVVFETNQEADQAKIAGFDELVSAVNIDFFGPLGTNNTESGNSSSSQQITPSQSPLPGQSYLKDYLQNDQYSVFVYYQTQDGSSPFTGGGNPGRMGLIIALKNDTKESELKAILKSSESIIPSALKSLWFNQGVEIPATPKFLDNTYKNIPMRYVNFPYSTLTIDYAIVKGYLLITTSKEAMYAAIDRLLLTPKPDEKIVTSGYKVDYTYETGTTGQVVKQIFFTSPSGERNLVPDDIAILIDGPTRFAKTKDSKGQFLTNFDLPISPKDSDIIFLSTVEKSDPIQNNPTQQEIINRIYSYNLGNSKLTEIFRNQTNNGNILRIVGISGTKILFYYDLLDNSPGPCFNIWDTFKDKMGFLDIVALEAGAKPFTVPTYKLEETRAESENCLKELMP